MYAAPKPLTKQQLRTVQARLLPTWQTAAAIAQHSGFPARTVLAALRKNQAAWALEMRVARLDGHNEVHLFRRRQRVLVLGVSFPMEGDEGEEV